MVLEIYNQADNRRFSCGLGARSWAGQGQAFDELLPKADCLENGRPRRPVQDAGIEAVVALKSRPRRSACEDFSVHGIF